MDTRNCSKCKESLAISVDNFPKNKNCKHGVGYICRPCEKIRSKERYKRNPRTDRYSGMTAEQKAAKVAGAKLYRGSQKGRAINLACAYRKIDAKKGFVSDITQQFLIEKVFSVLCTYCGLDIHPRGCDRIDNKKGHTQDNVVAACAICNVARMDNFSYEEMLVIGSAIRRVILARQ